MELESVKKHLSEIGVHEEMPLTEIESTLKTLKANAVKNGDENTAKEVWCFEQIYSAQTLFVKAFKEAKEKKYYSAWCLFERVEVTLHWLENHFNDLDGKFHIDFLRDHTERFQALFPYRIFLSPELIIKGKTCTICNRPVSLRNFCGHISGEIYGGEMCGRIVHDMECLGIALVENPVQKYSVVFSSDPSTGKQVDHYNYSLIEWVVDRLASPFHEWTMEKTEKVYPHSQFKLLGRNDRCPCNSGEKYKKCCMQKAGVILPHFKVNFSVTPTDKSLKNEIF